MVKVGVLVIRILFLDNLLQFKRSQGSTECSNYLAMVTAKIIAGYQSHSHLGFFTLMRDYFFSEFSPLWKNYLGPSIRDVAL